MAFDELSDQSLRESLMELEKSKVALGNLRSREKTLEDALDAYEALVEVAKRTVDDTTYCQAVRLKAMG